MFQPIDSKEQSPIFLHSTSSGKNLRVHPATGQLSGTGGWGKFAKFILKPTQNHAKQWVRLAPFATPNRFVKIGKMGPATATGGMGKMTLMALRKLGPRPGTIRIQSVMMGGGHHVGVLPNGEIKLAGKTGKGLHGTFTICSAHLYPGARVFLENVGTNQTVAFVGGKHGPIPHAFGGKGKWAKWVVQPISPDRPEVVKFQHWVRKGKYLAVNPQGKVVMGAGGKWCHFYAKPVGGKRVLLRATAHQGQAGLGFAGKWGKPGFKVGAGVHGQFRVHHW